MVTQDILDTTKLTLDGDFDEQVNEILQYVRLTKEEVLKLQTLFDDVFSALSKVWDGIKVQAFGSIVTGLGIKASDVDCYVQLPSWLSPPENSFVFKARNILRQEPWKFEQLLAISNARIPIIKFYHTPTSCSCDLSFSSPMGVENSKLISYYLNLDRRVLKLAILIKYWSKIHGLTGTNLMPSYCLTMLMIYYLQQKGIAPPVVTLQENTPELLINNWNMAFDPLEYHTHSVDESLWKLLEGFYKFYHNFNFEKYVLSLYLGRSIERETFNDVETLPVEFSLYHKNVTNNACQRLRLDTGMCVQDPFEHSRNCAIGVHPKLCHTIIDHFKIAASIFDNSSERSVLKKLLSGEIGHPRLVGKANKRSRLKGVQKKSNHTKSKNYNVSQSHNQKFHNIKRQIRRKQQQWSTGSHLFNDR